MANLDKVEIVLVLVVVFFLYMVGLLVVNVMYVTMVRVIVMDGGCFRNLQITLTI